MSEMRGVSSPTAARPRRISSSESNSASIHAWLATSSGSGFANARGFPASQGCTASCVAVSWCRMRSRSRMARALARSPRAAVAAAESSRSVTLAIALTTTMGCNPLRTRPATISAVRRIATASSTEVPPNFITTRRFMPAQPPDRVCPARQAIPHSAALRPPRRGWCCGKAR